MAEEPHAPAQSELEKLAESAKGQADAHPSAHGPEAHGKEAKKPMGTLESVVDELGGAIKGTFNIGLGAATPVAGYALTGNPGVFAISAGYLLGTKGKKDSKTIRDELMSGGFFGAMAHYLLLPLKKLSMLGKTLYMTAFPLAGNAAYMFEDHLVKKKTFSGMKETFKNYGANLKRAFKSVYWIQLASALILPQSYVLGAVGLGSFVYRRFVIKAKGEEYQDKRAYLYVATGLVQKLVGNTARGVYQSIGAIASGVGDTYKSLASGSEKSAPAAAHPEPAAAHGH
ncbi:MAG: hypothetical protein AABX51_08280 [Nanoarchaeota archaeon]